MASEKTDRLDALRKALDDVDRNLLQAVSKRRELVEEIALAKRSRPGGHPLFDRVRERQVYQRTQQIANELNLDHKLAQDLMEILVEDSHRVQESVSIEAAKESQPLIFGFIGGEGQMAKRIGRDLTQRGHNVLSYDLKSTQDLSEFVASVNVVVIAVPMASSTQMAKKIAPMVAKDALLCDINSLKQEICTVMAERCQGEVMGLHPMFGPTVHTLRRQKIVYCSITGGPLSERLLSEFAQMGVELIDSDPSRHDQMMALVQVLVHYSTLVMGDALRQAGMLMGSTAEDSLVYTSPIYRLELSFIARLFTQDPALYAEIEMTNPYGRAVRDAFAKSMAAYANVIDSNDRVAFNALFQQAAEYFSDMSQTAMTLSDHIIDTMVRRP